jgi:predicted ATPase
LYFSDKQWVKILYGSSGQQEALWILLLIFTIILQNKKVFMIIEEPEAHLYPIAQKQITELISLLVNSTGSEVFITTHSPYILTSMNVLLYSGKIENNKKVKNELAIIPKQFRISKNRFFAYKIDNTNDFCLNDLMDSDTGLIRALDIDTISAVINEETERLIDMEIKYDL